MSSAVMPTVGTVVNKRGQKVPVHTELTFQEWKTDEKHLRK